MLPITLKLFGLQNTQWYPSINQAKHTSHTKRKQYSVHLLCRGDVTQTKYLKDLQKNTKNEEQKQAVEMTKNKDNGSLI